MPPFKREAHKIVSVLASVECHHAALGIFTVEDSKLPVAIRPRLAEGDRFVVLIHVHNLPHKMLCFNNWFTFLYSAIAYGLTRWFSTSYDDGAARPS